MSALAKTAAGKVPATVITGFLGAGKTTLIRGLLEKAEGRRLALIINEFGDVGIDGDILRACGNPTCTEDDVIELANGCLCCTVADDFVPAIEKLLARPEPPERCPMCQGEGTWIHTPSARPVSSRSARAQRAAVP